MQQKFPAVISFICNKTENISMTRKQIKFARLILRLNLISNSTMIHQIHGCWLSSWFLLSHLQARKKIAVQQLVRLKFACFLKKVPETHWHRSNTGVICGQWMFCLALGSLTLPVTLWVWVCCSPRAKVLQHSCNDVAEFNFNPDSELVAGQKLESGIKAETFRIFSASSNLEYSSCRPRIILL